MMPLPLRPKPSEQGFVIVAVLWILIALSSLAMIFALYLSASARAMAVSDTALQQEALVLFEYEGVTLEEIARIVGADVGTVKSRLHRARERLRRDLAPYRSARGIHGTV